MITRQRDGWPDLPNGPDATWDEVKRWTSIAVLAETCHRDFELVGLPITWERAWQQAEEEWEKLHG